MKPSKIKSNQVKSNQIKSNQITSHQIKKRIKLSEMLSEKSEN